MKLSRISRPNKEGVNSHFRPEDQRILDQENPALAPKTQLFTRSDDDLQESANQINLCAKCGAVLQYLERTQLFICNSCHEVSQSEEDSKLKHTSQDLRPFQSQYFDANNLEGEPFFVSWNPDKQQAERAKDYEITYDNGRVKKIKCKGFPLDISKDAFND